MNRTSLLAVILMWGLPLTTAGPRSSQQQVALQGGAFRPACGHLPDAPATPAELNDNRVAAGTLREGVLTLNLGIRQVAWRPEGPDGCALGVLAFAVEGQPAQIPGPLIRVPTGTELRITLRNPLDRPVWVRGFADRVDGRGLDPVEVAPGATHTFRFTAEQPGTFAYWAREAPAPGRSSSTDGQLVGALIVDGGGLPTGDRVFVLTQWRPPGAPHVRDALEGFELNAMNGASWPHTERIPLTAGTPARWRVINGGPDVHMMHLHGFHYTLLAEGTTVQETVHAPGERRTIVTQFLGPGGTMAMEWVPTRPGNWIFHCHLARHMSAAQRLDRLPGADAAAVHHPTAHAMHEMAGLIIGVQVAPAPDAEPAIEPEPARRLRLVAQTRPGVFGDRPGFGFVLDDGEQPLARDSIRIPGSPIIVTRDELVEITVHNHLPAPLSVHWHGLELESYFDGVAGWSGTVGSIAPPIAPGDSFIARMAPPRAGTFIYHAHNGANEELASGLYGPFLVLEPGAAYDPASSLVFVISEAGPGTMPGDPKAPFVNGSTTPAPIRMVVGRTYRIRYIDISENDGHLVTLRDGEGLAQVTPVALDGADLPPPHRALDARFQTAPGMTTDFEYTPQRPGELRLVIAATSAVSGVEGRATVVPIRVTARAP